MDPKPRSGIRSWLARSLALGVMQAVAFGALASLVFDSLPIEVRLGEASRLGDEPLDELAGLDRLRLSLAVDTANDVLTVDEAVRRAWVKRPRSEVPIDPDTGLPMEGYEEAADPDARPESWPLEGAFAWWSRPGLCLASARGVALTRQKTEMEAIGLTLDPLSVDVPPTRAALLVVIVAPFLGLGVASLFRRRDAGLLAPARRLGRGLSAGVFGALLTFGAWLAAARSGVPRLTTEWRDWVDARVAAGELEAMELVTWENGQQLLITAGVFVAASVVAALTSRR